MGKVLEPGQVYAGRRSDVIVLNCTLDREASILLRQYSGGKVVGRFVSRLIHEHHARQQERARVREQMAVLLGDHQEDV